jgi:hypothetical protein
MTPSKQTLIAQTLVWFVLLLPAAAQTSATWTATGQLANSTQNASAVLLQSGRVLAAGGDLQFP